MPADLPRFYLDLADLRMESAICLFHQRFQPTLNLAGHWRSRSVILLTTVRSIPLKATANGPERVLINSLPHCCPIYKPQLRL